MELWELFLLAVGLSMDAFAVSVSSAMTTDNLRKRDAAFIGGKMILEAKEGEDACHENPLKFAVLLVLAIATSIDALAVGITFAFMPELPILPSVILIGVVTFLISTFGALLGRKAGSALGTRAEIIGGLILIGIGLKILIEHLFFA